MLFHFDAFVECGECGADVYFDIEHLDFSRVASVLPEELFRLLEQLDEQHNRGLKTSDTIDRLLLVLESIRR